MKQIKTALISVYDKTGLEPIIDLLKEKNIQIYSTGGTKTFLENLGCQVISVESVTDYPSILGGRVKTLHPKIFGGILNRRDNQSDVEEINKFEIPSIDMVIVDLYPFHQTSSDENSTHEDIIEKIDIGGISLIRASAKNYKDVFIVSNKKQYIRALELLSEKNCSTSEQDRLIFAKEAFGETSNYDSLIYNYYTVKNIQTEYEEYQ